MNRDDVFNKMIENKQSDLHIDPWADSNGEFNAMEETNGVVEYREFRFLVSRKSGSGVGMGETPPTIDIAILHTFN